MLHLYGYAISAGILAVTLETIIRYSNYEFFKILLISLPFQLILVFLLYNLFSKVDYLLSGAIMFALGTYSARLISSYFILGETPPAKIYIAFGLILLAQVVRMIPTK